MAFDPRRVRMAMSVAFGLAAVALVPESALAQSIYRCRINGAIVISSQPCPQPAGSFASPSAAPPTLGAYGSTDPGRNPYGSGYVPGAAKAQEHVSYLSPRCAEISEGIRTGPSRGVRSDTLSELQQTYRATCSEQDADARRQVAELRRRESDQRRADKKAELDSRLQATAADERCNELLRILAAKRLRVATMTEGEKSDLQRSEGAYQERCKRG